MQQASKGCVPPLRCRMLRWRPAGGAVAAPGDDDVLSRLLEAFDAKPLQGSKQTREKRFEANIHLMKHVLVSALRSASRLAGRDCRGSACTWSCQLTGSW